MPVSVLDSQTYLIHWDIQKQQWLFHVISLQCIHWPPNKVYVQYEHVILIYGLQTFMKVYVAYQEITAGI